MLLTGGSQEQENKYKTPLAAGDFLWSQYKELSVV